MKKVVWTFLILSLGIGCSATIKQKAVAGLQIGNAALNAAYNTEVTFCSPTSDPTKPISHCDGPQAVALGYTDAKHQAVLKIFAKAFGDLNVAANALTTWKSGDPAPNSVATYKQDITDLLNEVSAVLPKTNSTVMNIQLVLNEVANIATIVGVQ